MELICEYGPPVFRHDRCCSQRPWMKNWQSRKGRRCAEEPPSPFLSEIAGADELEALLTKDPLAEAAPLD